MQLDQEIEAHIEGLKELLNKMGALGYLHGTQLNLSDPEIERQETLERLQLETQIAEYTAHIMRQTYLMGEQDGQQYA